jgi:hypothetical protein
VEDRWGVGGRKGGVPIIHKFHAGNKTIKSNFVIGHRKPDFLRAVFEKLRKFFRLPEDEERVA